MAQAPHGSKPQVCSPTSPRANDKSGMGVHIDPHAVPVLEPSIVLSASVSKALGQAFFLVIPSSFGHLKKSWREREQAMCGRREI